MTAAALLWIALLIPVNAMAARSAADKLLETIRTQAADIDAADSELRELFTGAGAMLPEALAGSVTKAKADAAEWVKRLGGQIGADDIDKASAFVQRMNWFRSGMDEVRSTITLAASLPKRFAVGQKTAHYQMLNEMLDSRLSYCSDVLSRIAAGKLSVFKVPETEIAKTDALLQLLDTVEVNNAVVRDALAAGIKEDSALLRNFGDFCSRLVTLQAKHIDAVEAWRLGKGARPKPQKFQDALRYAKQVVVEGINVAGLTPGGDLKRSDQFKRYSEAVRGMQKSLGEMAEAVLAGSGDETVAKLQVLLDAARADVEAGMRDLDRVNKTSDQFHQLDVMLKEYPKLGETEYPARFKALVSEIAEMEAACTRADGDADKRLEFVQASGRLLMARLKLELLRDAMAEQVEVLEALELVEKAADVSKNAASVKALKETVKKLADDREKYEKAVIDQQEIRNRAGLLEAKAAGMEEQIEEIATDHGGAKEKLRDLVEKLGGAKQKGRRGATATTRKPSMAAPANGED